MSAPVLSWLLIAHWHSVGRARKNDVATTPPPPAPKPWSSTPSPSHVHPTHPRRGTQVDAAKSPEASLQDPMSPTLRANPYPEVTDLFCRLPLPTLFYQLEAVHLGDLLRLSVRPGTKIILSFGFSRAIESAPDTTRSAVLCRALYPISR